MVVVFNEESQINGHYTQIHERLLSWPDTGTSIKSGVVK
jgi:hypothetical protein